MLIYIPALGILDHNLGGSSDGKFCQQGQTIKLSAFSLREGVRKSPTFGGHCQRFSGFHGDVKILIFPRRWQTGGLPPMG